MNNISLVAPHSDQKGIKLEKTVEEGIKVLYDENVIINVSDSGIGMNQNQINRIYDSKSVVSLQRTQNEKGTGLGLYLIKEFIEVINGELKIKSKINKGTTVTCIIPNK